MATPRCKRGWEVSYLQAANGQINLQRLYFLGQWRWWGGNRNLRGGERSLPQALASCVPLGKSLHLSELLRVSVKWGCRKSVSKALPCPDIS